MMGTLDWAKEEGLTIVQERLPDGRRGEYRPDMLTIVLDPRLTERQARCTLAHEIAHHVLGHRPTTDPALHARQERAADLLAARELISPAEYALAERLVGPHIPALAHELNVTPALVRAWQAALGSARVVAVEWAG